MLEPLGQSQVLAYVKKLSIDNNFFLISFEKNSDLIKKQDLEKLRLELKYVGINWYPLKYHKKPSTVATAFDIGLGLILGFYLIKRYKIEIIHARSYVACLIGYILKCLSKSKLLFDMRGFWADEKIDGNIWTINNKLYHITKQFEKLFLLNSDHVVTLTHSAVKEMKKFNYLDNNFPVFSVITTCADLKHFKPLIINKDPLSSKFFTLGYIGSVGTYYMFDKVLECFILIKKIRPNAKLLIVNRGQHDFILNSINSHKIPSYWFELTTSTHSNMPSLMAKMDAGIFFIKPVFSKQASAPTKLAEFLGCGIPCLSNSNVGDVAPLLENEKVGVALNSFDQNTLNFELNRFLKLVDNPSTSSKCVDVAERYFSLDTGVNIYRNIYNSLILS